MPKVKLKLEVSPFMKSQMATMININVKESMKMNPLSKRYDNHEN